MQYSHFFKICVSAAVILTIESAALSKESTIWANGVSPSNSPDALHLSRGVQLANKQSYEKAAHEFMQCQNFDLLNPEAVENVCNTFNQAEEYQQAIKIENYMLERISKSKTIVDRSITGGIYGYRASSYSSLGKYDQALSDYKTAAKLKTQDATEFLYQAGDILRRKGRYQEAIEILDQSIACREWNPFPYKCRGVCLMALGHEGDAIKSLNMAVKQVLASRKTSPDAFTPLLLDSYKALVICYKREKRIAQAREIQQKISALTGSWDDTLFGAAVPNPR